MASTNFDSQEAYLCAVLISGFAGCLRIPVSVAALAESLTQIKRIDNSTAGGAPGFSRSVLADPDMNRSRFSNGGSCVRVLDTNNLEEIEPSPCHTDWSGGTVSVICTSLPAVCYRRLPLLGLAESRNQFVKILGEVRTKLRFALVGYVVMPEHAHLLIGEPPQATPSDVMRELKQRVARALLRSDSRVPGSESRVEKHSPPRTFWQTRFYDFNVWTRRKHNEKLNYMHMNPVRRGLVKNPNDWPWSSYRAYMKTGTVLLFVDPVE